MTLSKQGFSIGHAARKTSIDILPSNLMVATFRSNFRALGKKPLHKHDPQDQRPRRSTVAMIQTPWRQLAFVIGEAALSLLSGSVVFVMISRSSGPGLLGTYALVLAWLSLFQGLGSFGIPEFLMREVGAYGLDAGRQIFHGMLLGILSSVLAIALMLILSRSIGYEENLATAISVSSLALIPSFLSGACRSVFLALRQMHLGFFTLLVESLMVSSISLYLLHCGYGAMALVIVLVIGKLSSAVFALVFIHNKVSVVYPPFERDSFINTAMTVVTFGIGSMLGMVTMRINMIMVSAWVDITQVGQYAAATKLADVGMVVPSLYAQILMTRMSYHFNVVATRNPNHLGAWYQTFFAVIVPTCVGVWVFADPLLQMIFGPNFENASWVLRILMIYLIIESLDVTMSVILISTNKQKLDVACLAFNPLTNIALNLTLLPILGMVGAACGRVGGATVSATLRHMVIAYQLGRVDWVDFLWKPISISVALGAISYWLFDMHRPTTILAYAFAAAALLWLTSSFSFAAIKDLMSVPQRYDATGQSQIATSNRTAGD